MPSLLDDYLDKLRTVVNLDCGSYDPEGLNAVSRYFQIWFAEAGFQVEAVNLDERTGTAMLATNKPHAAHYDLLLSGHLDTVFERGTAQARPFRLEGQKAYGPGVADMKNGCLQILFALKSLSKELLDKLAIVVILNPDEEIGSPYSHAFIDEYAQRSTYALVFESQEQPGLFTAQRKGIAHLDLFMHGVGAHAGFCPELGRSAITAMAHAILSVNALATDSVTVNFGVIKGGLVANAIPAECSARIDVRFWELSEWEEFFTGFKALCKKGFLADVTAEFKLLVLIPPMVKTQGQEQLKALLSQAAQEVGLTPAYQNSGGVSDGNHISQVGTPVLDSLGPLGGGCHTEGEWLDIGSVESSIQLLCRFIELLAKAS
ncbi:MAG: M20 family metallopeptidase [Succinivibrio sp.]|nr:M20 family metallopeptidase [Succinivibrio sp.]